MTITTLADGTFEFKEVYNAINLKSANGEQFSICMRDTGFEFTYEGKTFVAKNKLLGPTKQVKTNISESNVSWVANNLSKDLVTNTQCIILLTQLLQLLRIYEVVVVLRTLHQTLFLYLLQQLQDSFL